MNTMFCIIPYIVPSIARLSLTSLNILSEISEEDHLVEATIFRCVWTVTDTSQLIFKSRYGPFRYEPDETNSTVIELA